MHLKKDDYDIVFGVIGDSHITFEGSGVPEVDNALKIYKDIGVDALVFTGDIIYEADNFLKPTERLLEEPYLFYKKLINENAGDIPIVYCMGNHEYAQNTRATQQLLNDAVKLFVENVSQPVRYHTVIKDFHFITANVSDFSCNISRDTECWVEQEVTEALKNNDGRPIFVIIHEPIQETVIGSENKENAKYSDEFKRFLNKDARIVFLCGHIHTAAQNPLSIWQEGFTVVHSPHTSVGALSNDGIKNEDPVWRISQGLLFCVKNNLIKIFKIDFNTHMPIGMPWEIDINAGSSGFLYTDKRFEESNPPYFESNAEIEARIDLEGTAEIYFTRAVCKESKKNQDGFAAAYNIRVTETESKNIVSDLWYQADYYYSVPINKPLCKKIHSLCKGKSYIFEIKAANPFGKMSVNTLRKEIIL